MNTNLQDRGFKWFYSPDKSFAAKGYFHNDGRLFTGVKMLDVFNCDIVVADLISTLKRVQGSFSVIKETQDYVIAAVDKVRSFPLFYRIVDGRLYITDDAHKLLKKADSFNEQAKLEFVVFSYVLGKDTLVEEVKQLQAGEMLIFDKSAQKLELIRYYEFRALSSRLNLHEDELIQQLDELHSDVFKRFIESCDGRQIVIPLSGGYDSRVIAVMLRRFNYDNVVCFSYGLKKNWESEISHKVAKALGFKWIFCEHSRKDWYNCRRSDQYSKFQHFAGNLTSLAHWQDFLAFKRLVEEKLIDCDAIAVPGHSYGFLAGSHIKDYRLVKTKDFKSVDIFLALMNKHSLSQANNKRFARQFGERIGSILKLDESAQGLDEEKMHSWLELFDWQERQAKFICNAVRIYEFFEHEWRMPLLDNVLMDFWGKVDLEHRHHKKLLKHYYAAKFPKVHEIPANPPLNKVRRGVNILRNPWYSQFAKSKRAFSIFTTKLAEAVEYPAVCGFDFIPWHRPLITNRYFNFIATLGQMKEMSNERDKFCEDSDCY